MKMGRFVVVLVVLLELSMLQALAIQSKADTQNSAEFVDLFNGENLDGWYAIKTYDPRKVSGLSQADWKKRIDGAMADTQKFWRVENGEIVNDGDGAFFDFQGFVPRF